MLYAAINKKMKYAVTVVLLLHSLAAAAQTYEEKLTATVKEFHQAMVNKNIVSINQQTDKSLSFGHSNGWVETKADLIKDIETGYISYGEIKEDSITITMNGNLANVRFKADITVTMKGTTSNVKLRVLEVWVKKSNRWMLFARQAVKQ